MGVVSMDPRQNLQRSRSHGLVVEEIDGLIKVYTDGHVERPQIVPNVPFSVSSELGVTSKDIAIANLWARVYVPNGHHKFKFPLLFYFHGGGFCVGSPSWICYHNFVANLASRANCVIVSLSYRLAPESRLPAAYDDGFAAVAWAKQQAANGISPDQAWWLGKCDFTKVFICGDSAGANIAYNVSTRLSPGSFIVKGVILIQPFFGGEARTESEKQAVQVAGSALTLSASDAYWRLALPIGANRDHPWCNPLAKGGARLGDMKVLVCVSELDILRDRNLELCSALAAGGKKVERVVFGGVGHAFQVLGNSQISQARTSEMMSHIKAFINQ